MISFGVTADGTVKHLQAQSGSTIPCNAVLLLLYIYTGLGEKAKGSSLRERESHFER